jgi:hypothetical protein
MWHGDILHEVHMKGLVACLGELIWRSVGAFRRRAVSPRQHGITWLLIWRFVLDLRTLG